MESFYNYIYFLVYELKDNSIWWIVRISDSLKEVKDNIRNLDNIDEKDGKYYIIEKFTKLNLLDKKFKQFQIFKFNIHDKIVYMT